MFWCMGVDEQISPLPSSSLPLNWGGGGGGGEEHAKYFRIQQMFDKHIYQTGIFFESNSSI